MYKVAIEALKGSTDITIGALHFDSRDVDINDVFFAIRGTQSDGHNYIETALNLGAIAIVCDTFPDVIFNGVTYIQVRDTNKALALMAAVAAGAWFWSTRDLDRHELYGPQLLIREATHRVPDYLAIAHVGHGMNQLEIIAVLGAIGIHRSHEQLARAQLETAARETQASVEQTAASIEEMIYSIKEVAKIFAGIFICIVPVVAILRFLSTAAWLSSHATRWFVRPKAIAGLIWSFMERVSNVAGRTSAPAGPRRPGSRSAAGATTRRWATGPGRPAWSSCRSAWGGSTSRARTRRPAT